jgi:uncharacterized protein
MKLVLFALAVVALLWLLKGTLATWRGDRRADRRPAPPREGAEAMLRCAECGLHLPGDESLPGKGGVFCSDAHRAAHEARLADRRGPG